MTHEAIFRSVWKKQSKIACKIHWQDCHTLCLHGQRELFRVLFTINNTRYKKACGNFSPTVLKHPFTLEATAIRTDDNCPEDGLRNSKLPRPAVRWRWRPCVSETNRNSQTAREDCWPQSRGVWAQGGRHEDPAVMLTPAEPAVDLLYFNHQTHLNNSQP